MVQLVIKPTTNWRGGDRVDGNASVTWKHDGMNYKVSASEATFGVRGGGLSTQGVNVSVEKAGAFTFDYDVHNHSPTVTLHSSARFANKDMRLKYKHGVRKNAASMEASVDVDDKNSATVRWNLQNYERPDVKALNLRWNYKHNDTWTVEPEYDVGAEALRVAVWHKVDKDNKLKMHFDAQNLNGGAEWVRKMSDGDLKVAMKSNMNKKTFMDNMCLTCEKSWNVDV